MTTSSHDDGGDTSTMQDFSLNWFNNYTASDLFWYLKDNNWTISLGGNSFQIHEPVV